VTAQPAENEIHLILKLSNRLKPMENLFIIKNDIDMFFELLKIEIVKIIGLKVFSKKIKLCHLNMNLMLNLLKTN
jgi:hypothetical protein